MDDRLFRISCWLHVGKREEVKRALDHYVYAQFAIEISIFTSQYDLDHSQAH